MKVCAFMEIYLLRHGIAEDQRAGMRDADRALTSEGKKRLKEVLQVAKAADDVVRMSFVLRLTEEDSRGLGLRKQVGR